MAKKGIVIYLSIIMALLIVVAAWYASAFLKSEMPILFDGTRALADVQTQVGFGPRTPGSGGQAQILDWMRAELSEAGWESRIQSAEMLGHPIKNLVAYRGDDMPQIILGAHYDTRMVADNDPDPEKRREPVPGANDGASGVAVLLELARVLPRDSNSVPVWLVFFDAEDNGRIQGWDWILGSQAFVDQLEFHPEAAIIVDMIGDADLNIHIERNSNPDLAQEIWKVAADLGYERSFVSTPRHSMLDDHTPFLRAGIPAVDIIDFDYPYWHTTSDTVDKVSAESLAIVGHTLQVWIERRLETSVQAP